VASLVVFHSNTFNLKTKLSRLTRQQAEAFSRSNNVVWFASHRR